MPNKNAPPLLLIITAFATVYVVWGSTYFFIQRALLGLHPFLLGSIRFLSSGMLMMLWCVFRGEKIFSLPAIKSAALTGVLLLFVGNGVVIWVEQFMPSAVVAITVSAAPIWFVLLDKPRWKENFSSRSTILGLIVGFFGIVLLFGQQLIGSLENIDSRTILGLAMLMIGSMSWAGGSLYAKARPTQTPATVNTAWQMLIGGLAFIPGVFINGELQRTNWAAIPASSWLSILYLILMGSIAAYSAYVWLLQVRPATQVSTYAYVNPVIAVILGVAFANEHITMMQLVGLGVILLSVLLINLSKYRKEKAV